MGIHLDRNDFKQNVIEPMEKVENVNYHFSHVNREDSSIINYQEVVYSFNKIEEYQEKSEFTCSIINKSKTFRPKIIHSASNFVVGMAGAKKAAKALGIPSIYEIRGFGT